MASISRYGRMAEIYDPLTEWLEKKWFAAWRKKFLPGLKGKILEIGVGTGRNLEYYTSAKNTNITAIDSSSRMIAISKSRLKALRAQGRPLPRINVRVMNAENLRFQDNEFDIIVVYLVLCNAPNPDKVVQEAYRVLKPTGKIVMVEHVLSRKKSSAAVQRLLNPATKLFLGDDIARDTKRRIKLAGFSIIKEKNLAMGDIFRLFIATKHR